MRRLQHTSLLCGALLLLFGTACKEEEPPPPPSDPPVISSPEVTCGPATAEQKAATYEEYALPVVVQVSVQIEDPQRDLLDASVRGELNGFPIPTLTDDDADLRYVWTAPVNSAPIACKGELVVRFWAADQDENKAELTEIIKK